MVEREKPSDLSGDTYRLVIGNFDGVHIGHQNLLKTIKQDCIKNNNKLIVVTFIPHPAVILFNKDCFLINSYRERKKLLIGEGVDIVKEFDFSRDFSTQSPSNFLKNYIMSYIKPNVIYVGYDFTFGANREGNYHFLKNYCESINVSVELLTEFKSNNQTVSSSLIRNFIQKGDIPIANDFLGRPFFITGRVKKGQGRGRTIGLPTANLDFDKNRLIPACGVYSTEIEYAGNRYLSLTNVGHNPTFGEDEKINIETHILDFEKSIYGERIVVYFFEKIRDEKKFSSLDEFKREIKIDCEKRRNLY